MMDVDMECNLEVIDNMHKGTITQRQILDAKYMTITPVRAETNFPQFIIDSQEKWIDLSQTEISFTLSITRNDGTAISDDDNIGIINYPAATVFKDISISWNDKTVGYSSSNYAQRAYLEALIAYGKDAKSSWLHNSLFYKDTAEKMDSVTDENKGFKHRYRHIKNGLVDVRGILHLDVFRQEKFLPNNSKIKLEIRKNDDDFILMGGKDDKKYTVKIIDLALHVRTIEVSDDTLLKSAQKDLVYPIMRVEHKEYTLAVKSKSLQVHDITTDDVPEKIAFTFVKNSAVVGDRKKNPFNFEHFNLTQLSLWLNGQIINGKPLVFDFKNNRYLDGYNSLIRSMGILGSNDGIDITREEYNNGYTVFLFDLSPSNSKGDYVDPIRKGKISLELQWDDIPTETLTMFVYMQYAGHKITLQQNTKDIITSFA